MAGGDRLCAVAVILVFTFLFRVVTVTGKSMLPNFVEGEKVVVTSLGHRLEQGTVVVVTNVLEEPIIKRVIATEGQTVDIDYETGVVYVDGEPLDETQFGIENGITTHPYDGYEAIVFPQTVPEGCVFVLGDNRNVSRDSRYTEVGMIDTRHIIGKPCFRSFRSTTSACSSDPAGASPGTGAARPRIPQLGTCPQTPFPPYRGDHRSIVSRRDPFSIEGIFWGLLGGNYGMFRATRAELQ